MSSFQDDINSFRMRHGAVAAIIVANVGTYIALGLLGFFLWITGSGAFFAELINRWLALPADLGRLVTHPWTLFTHIFVHSYPGLGGRGLFAILHLVFNMLWLYWMGRLLQEYLGGRVVWSTFLLNRLSGALLYLFLFNLSPNLPTARTVLIGASGGVTAIIVATATLLPNFRIMLFIFGQVQLKWLALIFILIDILTIGLNPGGGLENIDFLY